MTSHNRFARGTGCFTCESCGRRTRQTPVTAGSDWPVCEDCFELAGYQNGISDNGPVDAADYIVYARNHARTLYAKGGALKDWEGSFWAERNALDEIHELALELRAWDEAGHEDGELPPVRVRDRSEGIGGE